MLWHPLSGKLKWMDKAPAQSTIETLHPLVRVFKEKLTAVEWAELELGAFEKTIEAVVKHCCMQIVVTAVKYRDCVVCKEPEDDLPSHLAQTYSGCNGFQNLTLSEQKVLKCLGDSISLSNVEMKVVLEAIWDGDKEVMIELLMKEITQVVTVELLQSMRGRSSAGGGNGERSKPLDNLCLTIMLDKNLDFLVEMLQKHAAWISCLPVLHDGQICQMLDAEQDTPVTPVEPEKDVSSLMGSTIVKVTKTLEKMASGINVIDSEATITPEEYNRTLQMILKDTQTVASEIVPLMFHSKSNQDIVDDSKSESKGQTLRWRKEAESKISALLIRSFTKMAIFNVVMKLKGKRDCALSSEGHQSLLRLLDGVDLLVDKILLPDEDQEIKTEAEECHYGRAARKISAEREKVIRKRLCALTLRHLNPDRGAMVCSRQEIQAEVSACTEEIVRWLNQQAKQHGKKGGITWDILEEIHRELSGLFPTAEKPLTKERARPEINTCNTSTSSSSSLSDVSDEDEGCEVATKADPILDGLCTFVVTQLVKKILGNYYFHPSEASSIAQTLKDMLLAELAGLEIAVELNDRNAKKIIKAVERELLRRMGSSGLVKQAMWAKREWVFQCIVAHLKKLLLTPLQTSRTMNFLDMYFKPFSSCFRSCSKRFMIGHREQHVFTAHTMFV